MQIEVRHSPSFATARLLLAPGEKVNAESGAMAMMSFGVTVEAAMQGGFMKAIKRSTLGGESLFVSTYTAHEQYPSWIDVAARLPGDIAVIPITEGRSLILTKGSWLASDAHLQMDTKFGGRSMFLGGEGAFVVRFAGTGQVVASAYGALDVIELPEGQGFTIDTGHLVAYDDGMNVNVRKVSKGWIQSAKSGEALVMDIQGPGRVWTQTRNQRDLIDWLTAVLPFTRN